MNKHEQKRLTDATLIKLDMLFTARKRTSDGGILIVVPEQVAEQLARDIHALAHDATKHIAKKARLDQPQAVAS